MEGFIKRLTAIAEQKGYEVTYYPKLYRYAIKSNDRTLNFDTDCPVFIPTATRLITNLPTIKTESQFVKL